MKPTGKSVAAAAVQAVGVGYTYDEMDCQAFVEHCARQAGGAMDYLGTNDMARRAAWLGTQDEARAQGRLVPGAGLLIREETELKKHHRAYLHVHEELEDCADEMVARMQEIFDETTDCVIGLMKDVHETFRVRKQEAAEDDADTVTIAKEDYETMIDDLLTMSEIIQCVADMRTQDVKAIREFGKFVPAFAAFEKNRLSLYREAAKEAEEIFDRWADEIDDLDENYEPDEYYSD